MFCSLCKKSNLLEIDKNVDCVNCGCPLVRGGYAVLGLHSHEDARKFLIMEWIMDNIIKKMGNFTKGETVLLPYTQIVKVTRLYYGRLKNE